MLAAARALEVPISTKWPCDFRMQQNFPEVFEAETESSELLLSGFVFLVQSILKLLAIPAVF